jgi:hypothetical protein
MLDIFLGRKKTPPSINEVGDAAILIQLDACLSEGHAYKNTVTSFPVETGLNIADHIKQDPEELTINGIVTNSPVSFFPLLTDFKTIVNGGKDRVMTAYEALLLITGRRMVKMPTAAGDYANITIETKPKIVDISTHLRVFSDMVIEELNFDFDNKTGDSLPFKAKAKKIRKVTTQSATINYTSGSLYGSGGTPDQADEADKGQQQTKEPTAPHMSALKALGNGGGISGMLTHAFDW